MPWHVNSPGTPGLSFLCSSHQEGCLRNRLFLFKVLKKKLIGLAGIRYHPWSKLLHPAHPWNTSAQADQQHLYCGDQLHTTALVQRTGINWHLLFPSLPLGESLWVTDSLPGYVWWIEMQKKGSFERSLGVWWGDQTWCPCSALFLESTWVFLYDSTCTLVEFTRTQLILQ